MLVKGDLLILSNLTFIHNVFYAICILKSCNVAFQLSPVASLNLGQSQNVVLGNELSFSFFLSDKGHIHEANLQDLREKQRLQFSPFDTSFRFTVQSVACGLEHVLVLTEDGGVHAYGSNRYTLTLCSIDTHFEASTTDSF